MLEFEQKTLRLTQNLFHCLPVCAFPVRRSAFDLRNYLPSLCSPCLAGVGHGFNPFLTASAVEFHLLSSGKPATLNLQLSTVCSDGPKTHARHTPDTRKKHTKHAAKSRKHAETHAFFSPTPKSKIRNASYAHPPQRHPILSEALPGTHLVSPSDIRDQKSEIRNAIACSRSVHACSRYFTLFYGGGGGPAWKLRDPGRPRFSIQRFPTSPRRRVTRPHHSSLVPSFSAPLW